jgi:AraC-like DNA-binding protein
MMTNKQLIQRRRDIAEACKTKSALDVAKEFGVSSSLIVLACRDHGVKYIGTLHREVLERRALKDQRDLDVSNYVRDHDVAAASKEFGISATSVYASCRKHGVKLVQGRARWARSFAFKTRSWDVIDLLLADELTYQEIADEVGLSRQRIGQVSIMLATALAKNGYRKDDKDEGR